MMLRQNQVTSASWLTYLLYHNFALFILLPSTNAFFNAMAENALFLKSTPSLSTSHRRHHNTYSPPILCNSHLSAKISDGKSNNDGDSKILGKEEGGGIYRPFANYAWSKLSASGLMKETMTDGVEPATSTTSKSEQEPNDASSNLPSNFQYNSSPAGGLIEGSVTSIQIKSCIGSSSSSSSRDASLRLGRFALLETLSPHSTEDGDGVRDFGKGDDSDGVSMLCVPDAIHVLNLVLFPNHANPLLALPILGIDLVTLPGGKHLVAMDFQPVSIPIVAKEVDDDKDNAHASASIGHTKLFPKGTKYAKYEDQIAAVYERHVTNQPDILPWGGDIPPKAQRFFSPYALWTRLSDDDGGDGLSIVQKEVYDAFCDYFDLYLEILTEVQEDWMISESRRNDEADDADIDAGKMKNTTLQGHREYLTYRQKNDPARPMLTRLYGKEWAEQAISEVLFKMI
mmetsp:Transcript_28577/g.33893  ORF Transcript_28577/g.33893 Transcript_28577/m.33893 type:complete len:456 (+) Transcript_28577:163-1530(+)